MESHSSLLGNAVAQLVEALCYKRKIVGSITDGVIGIFPAALWPWGWLNL